MDPMKGAIQLRNCNCNGNGNGNNNGRRRRCGCMKMARSCWENFPYYNGPCPNTDGCYGWYNCNSCNCNCDCDCGNDNDDNDSGSGQSCGYERCRRRCMRRCMERCRNRYDDDDDCGQQPMPRGNRRYDDDDDCDQQPMPRGNRRYDDDDDCGQQPSLRGNRRYDDDDCGMPRRRRRRRCFGPCCGMFMAQLPMAVGPNGIIPLVFNNPCKSDNFEVNSGLVKVERAGTYLATYTVRVPEAAALTTTITLNVDNASQSSAITQVGEANSEYTAQAIFQADEGDIVALRTSEAINVTDTAAQPMFTLSLVRLDNE